jgi:hypothetical protein
VSVVPRVYCDFNDRLDSHTFGLRVAGTVDDLRRQSIELVPGAALTLYDYDADEAGRPTWIVADAVVVHEPAIGLVARIQSDGFRWEPREAHRALIHWSPEHIQRGLSRTSHTTDPAWVPTDEMGWSLRCTFPSPPAEQGSPSTAEISFLMPDAPHDQLRRGAVLRLFERATMGYARVEVLD